MQKSRLTWQSGQSLVEVIVALAIFSFVALSTSVLFIDGLTSLRVGNELNEATSLAYEGIDAARSVRDVHWLQLENGEHGLDTSSGYWAFNGTSEVIGDYTRTITVEEVERDESGDIVASAGTIDPRTKQVTVDVTWTSRGATRATTVVAYLTDWNVFDWLETTDAAFGAGTLDNISISGTGDEGALELAAGVGSGGPGSGEFWAPGGGLSQTDDTDEDFAGGTFDATLVSGIDSFAQIELDSSQRWVEYVFRGDLLDEMYDIDIQDVSTGWAVGRDGNIIRQLGGSWYSAESPVSTDLNGVFIVDSTEGWAVGDFGTILRYDGFSWFEIGESPTSRDLNGSNLISETDAWAVGDNGTILHYNGGDWSTVSSPVGSALYAVDGSSDTFAVIVGFNGAIMHWNGTSWSSVTSPTSQDLRAVHVLSPTDAWAVGDNGTILHWNGSVWLSVVSPTTDDLQDLYMTSPSTGWAVVGELASTKSEIISFNGVLWSIADNPTNQPYFAIDFEGSFGAIAAGRRTTSAEGAVLETSGTTWDVQLAPGIDVNINDIEMSGESFGIAAGGSGDVLHWNGSAWAERETNTSSNLYAVTILSSEDAWAVGQQGRSIRWDGADWSVVTTGVSRDLNGVDAVSSSDIWAVGDQKTVIHWNGTIWTSASLSGTSNNFFDVEMVDTSDGWLAGQSGSLYRWNGSTWNAVTSGTSQQLNNISVVDANNVWIAGNNGTIRYWNGSSWSAQTSGVGVHLESIYMDSTTSGWAVGDNGTILSYNGTSWNNVSGTTGDDLSGVYLVSPNDAWASGQDGLVLHYTDAAVDVGTYVSNVIDSGDPSATWGFAYWAESVIGGTTDITVATRTGPTPTPDGSWSAWSSELHNKLGSEITSPDSRYLQYRLTLTTIDTLLTPSVDQITITWNEPTTNDIVGVSLSSGTQGHAVGPSGTDTEYNGSTWDLVSTGSIATWNAVDEVSESDAWVVGNTGGLFHYNGAIWSSTTSPTASNLHGIDMTSGVSGYAVGASGTILVYNGTSWASASSPSSALLRDVSLYDDTNGWAVGDGGVILRLSGGVWSSVSSPTSTRLRGVHALSSTQAWAVGDDGVIVAWNGTSWSTMTSPTSEDLFDVSMSSENSGYAVGTLGTIIFFNGIGWQNVNSPTPSNLHDVFMVSDENGWAVGDNGTYIHISGGGEVSQGYASAGTFESVIFNSDDPQTAWQTLFWTEELPSGTDASISVRTGDTSAPDASWTSWSLEHTEANGSDISLQVGQYMQYRVRLSTSDPGVSPVVSNVTITYK